MDRYFQLNGRSLVQHRDVSRTVRIQEYESCERGSIPLRPT